MVSEHASPLAALGGTDAGGQNVHVATLSTALARRGAEIVVHTRRDDPDQAGVRRVRRRYGWDRIARSTLEAYAAASAPAAERTSVRGAARQKTSTQGGDAR